jgi:hypothetical protein
MDLFLHPALAEMWQSLLKVNFFDNRKTEFTLGPNGQQKSAQPDG